MKNFRKNVQKSRNGITLIALVITIIVLLILAGISISMLAGDNGILQRATDAKTNTEKANEKEQIQMEVLGSLNKNGKLEIAIVNSNIKSNISGVTTDDATEFPLTVTYTLTGNSYSVDEDGNVSFYTAITVSDLVIKDGDTVLEENCKSVELGKSLTINFNASILDGTITSITPNISYTTDGSKSQTFTILGKAKDGSEIKKLYTVNLKGYYKAQELKVGDFVKYDVTYTDMNNDITYDNSEVSKYGWRVLKVGNKNDDDSYSNVKLISSGAPAIFRYRYLQGSGLDPFTYDLLANDSECESLYELGLDSYPIQYKVSAGLGLYNHFKIIPFTIGTTSEWNYGYSKDLQDKNQDGSITGDDFLISGKADEVRNVFQNEISGNYDFTKRGFEFWTATPDVNIGNLRYITSTGGGGITGLGFYAIQPIISLISTVEEDDNGNWIVK